MNSPLKKIRFWLRLFSTFSLRHLKVISLFLVIGIMAFFSFPVIKRLLLDRNSKNIGIIGKFSLDNLPIVITSKISLGLTTLNEKGEISPSVASLWEITNQGKNYTFTLKENLFWHDKTQVKSDQIDFNFNDVTTSYPNDKQILFELREPFAPFMSVVSKPIFRPNYIGLGNYRLKSINRNGNTVESVQIIPAARRFFSRENITYKFYPTENSLITAFKLGEVDHILDISTATELDDWPNLKIESQIRYDRYAAVFLNTTDNLLADKNRRQALAYAIDKTWQPRALSSINPQSWAFSDEVKPYDYNLAKAKDLFNKSINEDQQINKEIELQTIPSLSEVADKIKTDWEKLGLTVKIRLINRIEENYQALLLIQQTNTDPDQYYLWHSTQTTNISRLKSPKIDKLLEEGRRMLDEKERMQIYQDFQKSLSEETPAIFLYHPTTFSISRN